MMAETLTGHLPDATNYNSTQAYHPFDENPHPIDENYRRSDGQEQPPLSRATKNSQVQAENSADPIISQRVGVDNAESIFRRSEPDSSSIFDADLSDNLSTTLADLSGHGFTHLPDDLLASLPNVKWLDLRDNKLETLPAAIGQLLQLETLLLDNNRLRRLPRELGACTRLINLHLADNPPLQNVPDDVRRQGTQSILNFLRTYKSDDEDVRKNVTEEANDENSVGNNKKWRPPVDRHSSLIHFHLPRRKKSSAQRFAEYKTKALKRSPYLLAGQQIKIPAPQLVKSDSVIKRQTSLKLRASESELNAQSIRAAERIKLGREVDRWRDTAKEEQAAARNDPRMQRLAPPTAPFATSRDKRAKRKQTGEKTPSSLSEIRSRLNLLMQSMNNSKDVGIANVDMLNAQNTLDEVNRLNKLLMQFGLNEGAGTSAPPILEERNVYNRPTEYRFKAYTG